MTLQMPVAQWIGKASVSAGLSTETVIFADDFDHDESVPDNYSAGGTNAVLSISTAWSESPPNSLLLSSTGFEAGDFPQISIGDPGGNFGDFICVPGQSVSVSLWAIINALDGSGLQLAISWFDDDDNFLGNPTIASMSGTTGIATHLTGTDNAPALATNFYVELYGNVDAAGAGSFAMDSLIIESP